MARFFPRKTTTEAKRDIYQDVTDAIVAAIEKGAGKWQMPWHAKVGGNLVTLPISVDGRPYRGINIPFLWAAAMANGYDSNVWGTYDAWLRHKAQVRRGEKATYAVLWKTFKKENPDTGEEETILFAKAYPLFNSQQVDGWNPKEKTAPVAPSPLVEGRIEEVESFFAAIPAQVEHGGNRACYIPTIDMIKMPEFDQFKSPEDYYSTRGHETIHWTGGRDDRTPRSLQNRFGTEAYAVEELVAELGAAFLCAILGISNEPRPDHAQYIEGWLKALKNDKKAIFTASSKAQQAVDYLVRMVKREVPGEDDGETESDNGDSTILELAA